MSNTWPGGVRHAMTPDQHERWNGSRHPGTRQLCIECSEATGRCEEDSIFIDDIGPFCESCRDYFEEHVK